MFLAESRDVVRRLPHLLGRHELSGKITLRILLYLVDFRDNFRFALMIATTRSMPWVNTFAVPVGGKAGVLDELDFEVGCLSGGEILHRDDHGKGLIGCSTKTLRESYFHDETAMTEEEHAEVLHDFKVDRLREGGHVTGVNTGFNAEGEVPRAVEFVYENFGEVFYATVFT